MYTDQILQVGRAAEHMRRVSVSDIQMIPAGETVKKKKKKKKKKKNNNNKEKQALNSSTWECRSTRNDGHEICMKAQRERERERESSHYSQLNQIKMDYKWF